MRSLLLCLVVTACGPGASDLGDAGPQPDAGTDAALWLSTQNAVRASAMPAPSPPLAPFVWSDAAAQVAQGYAAGCVYAHNPNRGDRWENIAASAPPGSWSIADAVRAWASEASSYDYASDTCAANAECGHYTQIVWRGTLRVGCGHALCGVNSPFSGQPQWDFWVCDYEPPGNIIGERPY